jgi:deoxyribodipyrimidine photolyase
MNDNLDKLMLKGLMRLAQVLQKKEINFVIHNGRRRSTTGEIVHDVPFLAATNTPQASQIICNGKRYDVWSDKGDQMFAANLSLAKAAKVVATEYFWGKAARIKARMPETDINEIIEKLERGYQR